MTTLQFLLRLAGVYVALSLLCGVAWALCGYMWNRVRIDPPIEDDEAEWAFFAERTR